MAISSRGKKEVQFTLKITPKQVWKYTPGFGINKVVYDKTEFESEFEHHFKEGTTTTKTKIKTQNCGYDEMNMMLTASAVNPDPLSRKYQEDLDREMTKLNIVSDSLTKGQEPNLLETDIKHQHHVGFVEDPAMEELDSLKKHMQKIRVVTIDQAHFNRIQSHMDRYISLYQRPSNRQAQANRFLKERKERDPHSRRKLYNATVAEW